MENELRNKSNIELINKQFKEFKKRVEFLKTIDKEILIGVLLGVTSTSGPDNAVKLVRYLKRLLKDKKK